MEDLMGEEKELIELYRRHTELVRECLSSFGEAIKLYIQKGLTEDSEDLIQEVISLESKADEIRREIIRLLIEKRFLLSNTRRDFLTLLEYTDKVADYSESTLDYIVMESMDITDKGQEKLMEIIDITMTMFEHLQKSIDLVFEDHQQALDNVEEIEKNESDIDLLERDLIQRLSDRDDLTPGQKALYRDFLIMLSDLSDIIEDAGDEIEVIVALRRL